MKIIELPLRLGALAVLVALGGPAWAACNNDGSETGANTVVALQGQGNFTCAQISGNAETCLNASCTMEAVPGFQYQVQQVGSRSVVTWSAPEQVDKIYVAVSGQGGRCLYDFEPGATSGSYLEPATSAPTVVACYDGVDDAVTTPPEPPISTTTNCETALPGLQGSLTADGNLITFIGIGTDQGLQGEGDTDGDYILAVCSAHGQTQCVDQCRQPTDATYAFGGTGSVSLADRPCATSEELPTNNADAPQYCWELSHQVQVTSDTNGYSGSFTPPKEKESGVAFWEQYQGSTCVKVTTTYRGVTYSYWSPTGCP